METFIFDFTDETGSLVLELGVNAETHEAAHTRAAKFFEKFKATRRRAFTGCRSMPVGRDKQS